MKQSTCMNKRENEMLDPSWINASSIVCKYYILYKLEEQDIELFLLDNITCNNLFMGYFLFFYNKDK
jgi:hypothetical protein